MNLFNLYKQKKSECRDWKWKNCNFRVPHVIGTLLGSVWNIRAYNYPESRVGTLNRRTT